jgi:chromosome segregation ATPase
MPEIKAAQASLNLQQAQINVATSAQQVKAAEMLYSRAVRDGGRSSEGARAALLNLRQARLQHRQALIDEKTALGQNKKAQEDSARASQQAADKVDHLQKSFRDAVNPQRRLNEESKRLAGALDRMNNSTENTSATLGSGKKFVNDYSQSMSGIAKQAGAAAHSIPGTGSAAERAAAKLQAAASAASALAQELGRIPTLKEITIRVHQVGGASALGAAVAGAGRPKHGRARGGFIPGSTGAPVPITAHAGEVVLNRAGSRTRSAGRT